MTSLKQKDGFSQMLLPIVIFVVLEVLIQQFVTFNLANWCYYQFGLSQLMGTFIHKTLEVVVVLGLNFVITKQKIYTQGHFSWLKVLLCLFLLAVMIPFLSTNNLMERIAGGLMGGVPEELFCRGVLLGAFLTYVIKYGYTYKKLILSIVSSSAIFGLLHFTNLTHAPFPLTAMQVIISILGGLTFAFIYVQTGSIWYAIAVHFTNNFLRTPNTGIDSSIQTAALAIFGYFTILVVVYFLWYDRKHTPQLVKNIKQ